MGKESLNPAHVGFVALKRVLRAAQLHEALAGWQDTVLLLAGDIASSLEAPILAYVVRAVPVVLRLRTVTMLARE